MRYRRWILGLSLVFASLATGASPAIAGNWSPEGDKALIVSSNFFILIGGKEDECEAMTGTGTLGTKSSTWSVSPEFLGCTFPILTEGSWTATDVNSEEATLLIPKKEKALVVELSKECSVRLEEGVTLGSTKDYVNGVSGAEDPSSLELASQLVLVKESKEKCAEAKKATISANMLLINLTSLTSPIKAS
jgi:hypothetical protein